MLQTDENATPRSLVKFFRCTNCVGEHVKSEPVSDFHLSPDPESELFDSAMVTLGKRMQMV